MGLLFEGRLQAVVDTVYPLAEGLQALRRLEQGDLAGKLVLEP
jgi:NADPH:quinone reductase-like Zn-dependent oxidoreductase